MNRIHRLLLAGLAIVVTSLSTAEEPKKPLRPNAPKGKVTKPAESPQQRMEAMQEERRRDEARREEQEKQKLKKLDSSMQPAKPKSGRAVDPQVMAASLDQLMQTEFDQAKIDTAPLCRDEDFLRRVSLDIISELPSPNETTLFGIDPSRIKRQKRIDDLIATPKFGKTFARYMGDVIYSNATNMRSRLGQQVFETWLADSANRGLGWNSIVTSMLTATGDVREEGDTALIFAHAGEPDEVAAEACRIFLGIQIQCANCHDHPSDVWKRQQFHELAAYFPRTAVRPIQDGMITRSFEVVSVNADRRGGGDPLRENPERVITMLDRNGDKKINKEEASRGPFAQLFDRLLMLGDTNKDGALDLKELKALPEPNMRRASSEYYMPDLNDPSSKGTLIQPKFFVDGSKPGEGLTDLDRRIALAQAITSPSNEWFAKAFVNRIWFEMLGETFYMPVDDLGPKREARFPKVLDQLSKGFADQGYDIKWLVKVIANTQAYQRQVQVASLAENALPFAAGKAVPLRADQVFDSLLQVLGADEPAAPVGGGPQARFGLRSPRNQFHTLFAADPSVGKDDILGNVPQSLFMMNSPVLRQSLSSRGSTRLAGLLKTYAKDDDALSELYLLVLAREPAAGERTICKNFIAQVGNRNEAYEDIFWSLLNSSEFLCRR